MDCSICGSMPYILRPPRNTICAACYDAAKNAIALMNKLEGDKSSSTDKTTNSTTSTPLPNSCKPQPLANVPKWMNTMKDTEDGLNEKINFLSSFVALFKDKILTDVELKPGDDGPSLSAHKALLAARSEIFRNMLDSDACKAPANDVISLPDLNGEELESLLEFLYSGTLAAEKLQKHVYALTMAADKYDIPYLLKFCERHMLSCLDSSNALDVLDISDACSNKALKDTALNFIVRNVEDVVFSAKYEAFVHKNPHLAVQITKAFFMDAKNRRTFGV
ncbi:hypothetical protein K2173_004966 [Erythroxylum novogranatense]|uniref:BTB domain-containing protein n=1 Tax=Erythroxylum novogranatense TaxID=1862640 RepID=A0AAV8TDE2_9ROSI|nr:hypothetical protein K2173_004966 [Erythroxylum novogranatense]